MTAPYRRLDDPDFGNGGGDLTTTLVGRPLNRLTGPTAQVKAVEFETSWICTSVLTQFPNFARNSVIWGVTR